MLFSGFESEFQTSTEIEETGDVVARIACHDARAFESTQQELLNNLYGKFRSFDRDARPPLREIVVLTVRANFAAKAYVAVFRDQATPPEQSFTQFC